MNIDSLNFKIVFLVVVAAVIGGMVLGLMAYERRADRFKADCIAKGGVPFMPRNGWICIDSSAVKK